jgi:hypothetical protein
MHRLAAVRVLRACVCRACVANTVVVKSFVASNTVPPLRGPYFACCYEVMLQRCVLLL